MQLMWGPVPVQTWAGPQCPPARPLQGIHPQLDPILCAQAMWESWPCTASKKQSENQLHDAPQSQKLLLCQVKVLIKEVGFLRDTQMWHLGT